MILLKVHLFYIVFDMLSYYNNLIQSGDLDEK